MNGAKERAELGAVTFRKLPGGLLRLVGNTTGRPHPRRTGVMVHLAGPFYRWRWRRRMAARMSLASARLVKGKR